MRKFTIGIVVMLAAVLGFAHPAFADGQGSCGLSGGDIVHVNVKELPGQGDVRYISIASPVKLDDSSSVHRASRAQLYYNQDNYQAIFPSPFLADSSPVDGDGYWNYRVSYNYTSAGYASLAAGRAQIWIEKYNSTSNCLINVYF